MKKLIGLCLFVLIGCGYLFFEVRQASKFETAQNCSDFMRPYADLLVQKLNRKALIYQLLHGKSPDDRCKTYIVYPYNWQDTDKLIPTDNPRCTILWLGSKSDLTLNLAFPYNRIWASTPLLNGILKSHKLNSTYVPLFALPDKPEIASKTKIGIIGQSRYIFDILAENYIPHRVFSLHHPEEIRKNIGNFKAVFVDNASLSAQSLDVHPILFDLMQGQVPIVSYWKWPTEDPLNRFNDTVNFYEDKKMAEKFVKDLENNSAEITRRTEHARQLITNEYSLDTAFQKAWQSFVPQVERKNKSIRKINLDIPTAVGHYTAGDYALAQDLATFLNSDVSLTFYNSIFKYHADVNVLIRGFLPDNSLTVPAPLTVLYLAYAQFSQSKTEEFIPSLESYVHEFIDKTKDIPLIFTASRKLTAALNKQGKKAFYLPQFTNPERFYYDYDDTLKSDVLFVGIHSFYRRAVPILLKHHLPVTVYGPHWPEGVATAPYADNRILRKYYSSAKIVLNDTREGMLQFGFISNRIFDASACGTLVISDYMPEIEEIYGESVPMWKTEEELVHLVTYYLSHPHEREQKAKQAQAITLKYFTAKIAAEKMKQEIEHFYNL